MAGLIEHRTKEELQSIVKCVQLTIASSVETNQERDHIEEKAELKEHNGHLKDC